MIERTDDQWLLEAIELARQCPPSKSAYSVGAVIVDSDGGELARGFSRESDAHIHAEESALAKIDEPANLSSATLYSTLEPCAERKSRPATCAQLIIHSGIKRVVIAWREPTLLVTNPNGRVVLRSAGITVIERPGIAPIYLGNYHSYPVSLKPPTGTP